MCNHLLALPRYNRGARSFENATLLIKNGYKNMPGNIRPIELASVAVAFKNYNQS